MVLPGEVQDLRYSDGGIPYSAFPTEGGFSSDSREWDGLDSMPMSCGASVATTREQKLERYRKKRSKRLATLALEKQRGPLLSRGRASSFANGSVKGHHLAHMKQQLNVTQSECAQLRSHLCSKDDELFQLRQELEYHRRLNQALLIRISNASCSNPATPSTQRTASSNPKTIPPRAYSADTSVASSPPFLTDIDLSVKKTELKKTNGPFLTKEELQQVYDAESQWEQEQRRHAFVRQVEAEFKAQNGRSHPHSSLTSSSLSSQQNPSAAHKGSAAAQKFDLSSVNLRKTNLPYSPDNCIEWDQLRIMGEYHSEEQLLYYQKVLNELLGLPPGQLPSAVLHSQHQNMNFHQNMKNSSQSTVLTQPQNMSLPTSLKPSIPTSSLLAGNTSHTQTSSTSSMDQLEPIFPDILELMEPKLEGDDIKPHLEHNISPSRNPRWGGPPSDVYEPPNKIGNALLPAFTTKLDFSTLPLNLKPTDSYPQLFDMDDIEVGMNDFGSPAGSNPESPGPIPMSPDN